MASIDYNIFEISTGDLNGFRTLSNEDNQLLTSAEVTKTFKANDNFIELSFYTLDNVRLQTIGSYTNYSILSGDTNNSEEGNSEIGIDPQQDYLSYGFKGQEVKSVYNFLDYPYSNSTNPQDFYIESISPDRTEIRVVSVNLGGSEVLETTNLLIDSFTNSTYTPDLHLYFGNNTFYSIVNIDTEEFRETNAVLIKLYNPLPSVVNLKVRLNIVEKVSDSIAFEINTVITPDEPVVPTLRGANFNVEVGEQSNEPSQYYNYTELFSFPTNNSNRELNSLFDEKGAELGIDYSEYDNFINFSSAEERIRNFKYKLDLINSYQSSLDNIEAAGISYNNVGISGSRVYYENLLNGVVNNFDHYEKHLYFESGSTSWPKSNISKPFINLESSDTEATNWYTSELQDAILYDAQNPDILTNSIPAYLKEDTNNEPYNLFINMIAQHFDNIWIYTDAVSNKYNADNRLNRGASKDLVEDLLKNFGIKLYTSNKSVEDLFKYFTVNSYDLQGEELENGTIITSGAQPSSQKDYQKEIYKRIYHNLPLLLKSKGTERGLRALINCFGIPSDVLKIKVYGGQSAENLPFFGGEQAWTGSIDKVRLDNTGSIVPGDTVSFYTSIINQDTKYTQDLHRIEVGFSPTDNVNAYIVSQSQELFPNNPFNIDDYIGDPRGYLTNRYTDLYSYAETIFENVQAYNVKDFVRLIKFFDNVLFRMVRDFTPARSVTDAGIIIKPHLLERYKAKDPDLSWTRPEYTGSIDTAFISGSNAGIFKNIGYGSTNGESGVRYNRTTKTPTGVNQPRRINQRNGQIEKNFGEAKFDGELRRSRIRVTDGQLNNENPYKQLEYPEVKYNVQFWDEIPANVCILSSEETNYVITSPQSNVNLSNPSIFGGTNPIIYSFLVDEEAPNVNLYTHSFPTIQYGTYTIGATHNQHPGITNLITGEQGCQEERTAIVVTCRLNQAEGIYPSTVTIDSNYNLFNWFFQEGSTFVSDPSEEGIINSEITYLVEGEVIGETIDGQPLSGIVVVGEDPTSYRFDNIPAGQQFVTVVAQDSNDSNCKIELTLPFDTCTLYNGSIPRGDSPTTEIQTGTGILISGGSPVDYSTYIFPFNFVGVTDTTAYEFRVKVIHRYTALNTTITNTYGPTSYTTIDTSGNTQGSNSSIPSDYVNLVEQFPDILEQLTDAGLPEVSDGVYAENYFTRQIQFRATTSADCTAEGPFTNMAKAPLERREVRMLFNSNVFGEYGGTFCYYNVVEVTVYIDVENTTEVLDGLDVIRRLDKIYKYPAEDDTTPADQGTYGDLLNNDNNIREGRRWFNNSQFPSGDWDRETNIPNTETSSQWSVNNGLLICGLIDSSGDNDTNFDGDVDDNDDGTVDNFGPG